MISTFIRRQNLRQRRPFAASPKLTRGVPSLAFDVAEPKFEGLPFPVSTFLHRPVTTAQPVRDEFWRNIPLWRDVSAMDFLSYDWSIRNAVEARPNRGHELHRFLNTVLPEEVPFDKDGIITQPRDELVRDVFDGIQKATMNVRVTPYMLSCIDWKNPRQDPIFRQFIPLASITLPDHPKMSLDSLHEDKDSPVYGLVHRYPDKALFLPISTCPTYCTYCTRARAVGGNTACVKKFSFKPIRKRWDEVFKYIENTPALQDIVVSGGDVYYLKPDEIRHIGERLINMPNIKRLRFASKGLGIAPMRFLDENDGWFKALKEVANKARKAGKSLALHTHINHPNEISWITEMAAQKLFEASITVRNQSVLLRGVNDNVETMSSLIRGLADNNISPYYVYMCDMVETNEHHRTDLQTMLDIESQIRGSIAGFMMPQFVVDLPGGGGKRLAHSFQSYSKETGVSKFVSPAVTGRDKANKVYEYHDPLHTISGRRKMGPRIRMDLRMWRAKLI